ncbi:GntR family transcriptional regulator [Bradyrhizobium sp. ma5]|uniref:GntR family transcriptional regulator n=1 Tax=Bradyrhizobium sp. ma5 TaxID=3344828 RepID=UPI0035D3E629
MISPLRTHFLIDETEFVCKFACKKLVPFMFSKALPPSRLSDDVYDVLRRQIVTGELRPNQPLIELDLAERLQVSRTPVRESLQRLANAGLVVPRKRGWAVREFTPDEIRQNAELRMALEGYAANLAATRGSPADIATIAGIHELRLTLRSTDENMRVSSNRNFHDAIMRAAGNGRLTDAIYHSGQFYFNAPIARATTGDELALGNADHALIVAAILKRDGAAAEQAMRVHIQRTFSLFWRVTGRSEPVHLHQV